MTELIIGLDAAAQLAHCGYSSGRIEGKRIRILSSGLLSGDSSSEGSIEGLARAIRSDGTALIAIDAPLGWPARMAPSLAYHRAGEPLRVTRVEMFRRRTDEAVKALTGKTPLEVGAEKIAHAAHHALALLSELRKLTGQPIPLAWAPKDVGTRAIEVYPGAMLLSRAANIRGYKKRTDEGLAARRKMANTLSTEIIGLDLLTEGSVDVFDAALCLLAARDFVEDRCTPPDDLELAQEEGWIWVRPLPGQVWP